MKKVNRFNKFLGAMLLACCIAAPKTFAYDIPVQTLNEIRGNVKHDTDMMKFERQRREVDVDYRQYQQQKEETSQGTKGSTVIQGAPAGSGDVIRAKVEELETKGVYVNTIEVAPSEILTREEIAPVIEKYAGKNLFITDIQQMIDEINNLYAKKGFVTARAYLPEQQVEDGSIYVDLIESRIGKITVKDNKWTKTNYITDRLPQKEYQLFDIVELERDVLDFNRYNEGIKLSANLKAGEKEGTTDIELSADEKFPFHIIGVMDNAGRRGTGSLRGGPMFVADSLFGYRDRMTAGSYFSGGAISPFFDYNVPVNKYDGRVGFSYGSTFAKVKWGPKSVTDLGIKARSYTYSLYYTQPIKRSPGFELKGYGSLNYKRAYTTMDALRPFTGSDFLSKDQVTSADLGVNLRKDTDRGIWYFNQDASMAFPIFDSRSSYFKYSGGMYRIHDFSHGVYAQLRANYQIIPNSKDIPYLDQFMTGGLVTVRGYSEGILMGKNGYFTSAELIFPFLPRQITSPRTGEKIPFVGKYLQGVVFADHAGVFPYVKQDAYGGSYFLASLGMGLRVQLPGDLSARLYWGYPLVNNAYETDRKYGRFHFELTLEPSFDKLLKDRSVTAKVVPQVQKEVEAEYINNYDDIRHYDYFRDGGGGTL